MNPRPLLPWRSVLALAAAVAVAVPVAAFWLDGDDDDRLLVLAPSSLAPIEDELDDAFADAGIGPVDWVFAGSQSLVAQVGDGVPADVVLVADEVTHEAVRATGAFANEASFARNHLVLAVAPGNPGDIAALDDLAEPDHLVGVCAPDVPCGRLAAAALGELGVTPATDTEEASVRALTTKLTTAELDAGLIYRSDALAAGLEVVATPGLDAFTNTYVGRANAAGVDVLETLTGDRVQTMLREAGFVG